MLCVRCLRHYRETDYDVVNENPVARHFYGRVSIEKAAALLEFRKGGISQTLLHALKYARKREIGTALGHRIGKKYLASGFLEGVDGIVPVPLHPVKLRKRGFNQSAVIAKGIEEKTGIPLLSNLLIRREYTETQTRKSRINRVDNVRTAFQIKSGTKLKQYQGRHLLIVDDVITTGATIEACVNCLSELDNLRVSVVALALGS